MAAALESYVTESIALLIVIGVLAVLVLLAARRTGLGRVLGPVELLARLPLEPRRSVYVVRIVDRVLILGASEAGLIKLGELERDALGVALAEPRPSFASVLGSLWRGASGSPRGAGARAESEGVDPEAIRPEAIHPEAMERQPARTPPPGPRGGAP